MTSPELMTGLGAALSIFLSSAGSAVASAQGGLFALRSEEGLWSFVPIVIAGVLAIYGIIVAVILSGKVHDGMSEQIGYRCFSAGLSVGLGCFCSGCGMATFLKSYMENHKSGSRISNNEGEPLLRTWQARAMPVTWKFCMVLVYLEAIGLYGLIVALILAQ